MISTPHEVDEYIHQQEIHATQVRQENEARFDPVGVRARLLARLENEQQDK
jgi:hypothetical protein